MIRRVKTGEEDEEEAVWMNGQQSGALFQNKKKGGRQRGTKDKQKEGVQGDLLTSVQSKKA